MKHVKSQITQLRHMYYLWQNSHHSSPELSILCASIFSLFGFLVYFFKHFIIQYLWPSNKNGFFITNKPERL